MFSEENYAPIPQFELASMLTALYCVTMSIKHAQTQFRQTLKLQSAVVTVNIKSMSFKCIHSFLLSQNNVSMQVWCIKPHWFRRQSSEKAEFTVFKDDKLEMRWLSKLGQGHQNHINSTFCHNDTIHYV